MKYLTIFFFLMAFTSCTPEDTSAHIETIGVDDIHATQEYDNYHKAFIESLHSGVRVEAYSDLSPLLRERFENGETYETIDENQFPQFPGAKEHLLAQKKEWKALMVLNEKFKFDHLSEADHSTIRNNYRELHSATRGGLQQTLEAMSDDLPTKE